MILQKWFDLSADEMIKAQLRLFEVENEFFKESLRNAALVGTSKIDFLLGDVLIAFMKKPYNGNRQGVVERTTFDMKINLCYGLGLIDEPLARTLHFLRKARNTFAHQPSAKDVDIKESKQLHSILQKEYMYMLVYASYSSNDKVTTDVQRIFMTLLMYLIMLLNYYIDRVKKIDDDHMLRLNSILPTCRIKKGSSISLIEPINLTPTAKDTMEN